MGITDPKAHMKSAIVFQNPPDAVQEEQNKVWGDTQGAEDVTRHRSRSGRSAAQRRAAIRALRLLSPGLAGDGMATMLALLIGADRCMSFWTQDGFDIDRTFTLANYWPLVAAGRGHRLVRHPLSPGLSGAGDPDGQVAGDVAGGDRWR